LRICPCIRGDCFLTQTKKYRRASQLSRNKKACRRNAVNPSSFCGPKTSLSSCTLLFISRDQNTHDIRCHLPEKSALKIYPQRQVFYNRLLFKTSFVSPSRKSSLPLIRSSTQKVSSDSPVAAGLCGVGGIPVVYISAVDFKTGKYLNLQGGTPVTHRGYTGDSWFLRTRPFHTPRS
jgi:hypothetical protein